MGRGSIWRRHGVHNTVALVEATQWQMPMQDMARLGSDNLQRSWRTHAIQEYTRDVLRTANRIPYR